MKHRTYSKKALSGAFFCFVLALKLGNLSLKRFKIGDFNDSHYQYEPLILA